MVVFDLDDTLYKEVDYVASGARAVAEAAAAAGFITADTAYDIVISAPTVAEGFSRLEAIAMQHELGSGFNIPHILNIYRNHRPDIKLPIDSRQLLESLVSKDITLGLITDGRAVAQREKIKALGLDKYISSGNILISEETGHDKHSQFPFRKMMELNPAERQFIYIGDNPEKDFRWPNELGWTTVMLRDIYEVNIHPQSIDGADGFPSSHQAQLTVSKLTDVLNLNLF